MLIALWRRHHGALCRSHCNRLVAYLYQVSDPQPHNAAVNIGPTAPFMLGAEGTLVIPPVRPCSALELAVSVQPRHRDDGGGYPPKDPVTITPAQFGKAVEVHAAYDGRSAAGNRRRCWSTGSSLILCGAERLTCADLPTTPERSAQPLGPVGQVSWLSSARTAEG